MEFFVTFGQKYRHEPHPKGGHPDGYFTIVTFNKERATDIAFDVLGEQWAFLYEPDKFDAAFYPRGCLAVITG